jgi:hypothetical protein
MVEAKERFHHQAMNIPGVYATSVGIKLVKGVLTDTIAICVYMTNKKPLSVVPPAEQIPAQIEGFPTDVIAGSPPVLAGGCKVRPLEGGIIVGGSGFAYGTLGCIVRSRANSGVCYALSNQHVFGSQGSKIYQPASYVVCDEIGTVTTAVTNQDVDCAISNFDAYNDGGVGKIENIGNVTGSYTLTQNDVGNVVLRKSGVTTGLRSGTLQSIHFTGSVNGTTFINQISIWPLNNANFAEPGDSGSAIVDPSGRVVGLLFAIANGPPNWGIANPIAKVFDALQVDIVVGEAEYAPRPYRETVLGKAEALLSESVRGQEYWQTFQQHRQRLQHMFRRIPRLFAAAQSLPQFKLVDVVRQAIADPDSLIPTTIADEDTVTVFARLHRVLSEYVEDKNLQRQLDALHQDIARNIGSSWRQALSDAKLR